MSDRGEYRAIHTVLMDGPDFQELPPDDRLTLLIVKLSLGPSGIDIVPALTETLVERTGMPADRVEASLANLERTGWIRRERNVLWLLDGLKHEPSISADNAKQRKGILNHVSGMPHLGIVAAFIRHYREWFDDADTLLNGYPGAQDTLSKHGRRKRENGGRKREKGNKKLRAGPRASGEADTPRATWLTPALAAWEKHFGPGSLAPGKAARLFQPLHAGGIAPEEIGRRLDRYCAAKRHGFCTPADFAEHHAEWAEPEDEVLVDETGVFTEAGERATRPAGVTANPYGPLPKREVA